MSKLKVEPSAPAGKSNNFLTRDVKSIARHGSASIAELRDFMARMKGKAAGEVLGEIAQSGLARGVGLSCIIFGVLTLGLTVGPFLWSLGSPPQAVQSTLPAAIIESINPNSLQAEETAEAETAKAGSAAEGENAGTTVPTQGEPPDPDDLLKQLNLDNKGKGGPTTNPFGENP